MLITGTVALTSMVSLFIYLFINKKINTNKSRLLFFFFTFNNNRSSIDFDVGIVKDPLAPSSFGGWLQHVGNQHLGVLLFLVSDFSLLIGVAALTCMQISQVFFPHLLN